MKLIENNNTDNYRFVQETQGEQVVCVGSILTNRFNDDSDVDLVVDFKKQKWKTTLITTSILNIHWKIYSEERLIY